MTLQICHRPSRSLIGPSVLSLSFYIIFGLTFLLAPSSAQDFQDIGNLCQSEGFYRDPSDCAQFYRCNRDKGGGNNFFLLFRFTCAPGLVFDPTYGTCNHPQNAPACPEGQGISQQPSVSHQPPQTKTTDSPYEPQSGQTTAPIVIPIATQAPSAQQPQEPVTPGVDYAEEKDPVDKN